MGISPSQWAIRTALACVSAAAMLLGPHHGLGAQETCGEYGTSVNFAESPVAAAKQALAEEKLVLVLHVSGHFEESNYT